MAEWWQVSWKRVGKTLLILFLAPLLIGDALFLVNDVTAPWRYARAISVDVPTMNLTPAALPDQSVAASAGPRVAAFGISLQLPAAEERPGIQSAQRMDLFPRGCGVVTVLDLANPLGSMEMMQKMIAANSDAQQSPLRTNYELMRAALEARPDQLKWWKSRSYNARVAALLVSKWLALMPGGQPYEVKFGAMRGFQIGDPSGEPYHVALHLFDPSDHPYEIDFDGSRKDGDSLTQAQINAVAASVQPLYAAGPAPANSSAPLPR